MTTDVQELPSGDIQRDIGVSTGAPKPQTAESSQPAPMGAEQRSALADANQFAQRLLDRSLTPEQRERVIARVSALQRWAHHGGTRPDGFGDAKPDARLTDNTRPPDAVNDAFVAAHAPATAEEMQTVRHTAVLNGLPPSMADDFMKIASQAQLPHGHAKDISRRLAHHYRDSGGNLSLAPEQRQEFEEEAARALGGQEKYAAAVEKVRAYLQGVGLLELVDRQYGDTSVIFDPGILLSLSHLAVARGLK